MSPPNKGNFVYYLNDGKKNKTELEHPISDEKLQKLLEALSKHAMKENTPEFQELESLLQNSLINSSPVYFISLSKKFLHLYLKHFFSILELLNMSIPLFIRLILSF